MKYFLSIILTFLINLPNCGMVFSDEIEMRESHDTIEMLSMYMDKVHVDTLSHLDIGAGMYGCCPNISNRIIERNASPAFFLESPSTTTDIIYAFPRLEIFTKIETYFHGISKLDSPPDPGEYISLIGSSVKKLN